MNDKNIKHHTDKYSKKEILILEAFNKLVQDGNSLNNIRVVDIAKEAKIGKGTVYEYFSSKEEVIAKSIVYKMQIEFINIVIKTNNGKDFKEKCYIGFEELIRLMAQKGSFVQLLLSNKEIHEILKCINDGKDDMIEFRNYILQIIEPIIQSGIQENIINKELDTTYIQSVFVSVCSGISTMIHFTSEEKIDNKEELKDISYTMLIKSLS